MARHALIQQRNNCIRNRFRHHRKKNPRWTVVAVIEETSAEFFLSPGTITKILKQMDEPVPSATTIIKYTQQQFLY